MTDKISHNFLFFAKFAFHFNLRNNKHMKKLMQAALCALLLTGTGTSAARNATVSLHADQARDTISRMIYGQFAEHLGSCIYGGIWVGEDSPIPNTRGYRNDAIKAVRDLGVPVLRWPGGCFADDYHWRDGIGPRDKRPTLINNNWGGTKEDNSFGTHEFLDFCELVGTEPYVSGNVGSGTVGEMAQWVEYMTSEDGPMAKERQANGRKEPWKVKYFGIGNESWGCGGNMRPEYYSDIYRRYSTYARDRAGNRLYRIASGASDYDYNWTETLMKRIQPHRMDGLSLHYYTVMSWDDKGSATQFDERRYYETIGKCLEIEPVIERHIEIMDRYDRNRQTDLLVDEWGTWWDEEPGSVPGHLYQQNTMRDAMVAALTLNVFHRHADRIHMANIAQVANVLQAMWLTDGDKLILTPTYHVFRMYAPHKDAVSIPLSVACETIKDANGRPVPTLAATASRAADGSVAICLTNPMLDENCEVDIALPYAIPSKISSAEILTSAKISDMNTFEAPETVKPQAFDGAKIKKGHLMIKMPKASIVALTLR